MKYHFIAIGGSVMHNLALALKSQGNNITGSDDEFFEPSLSRLKKAGILPDKQGWDENRDGHPHQEPPVGHPFDRSAGLCCGAGRPRGRGPDGLLDPGPSRSADQSHGSPAL